MESVGEILREARKKKGIGIPEVSETTKISVRILEALEDNRFDVLPAAIYVKGFLKTYSEYLGLDANEVIDQYLAYTHQASGQETDEWEAVEFEHAAELVRWKRFAWLAAMLVIVGVSAVAVVRIATRGGSQAHVRIPDQHFQVTDEDFNTPFEAAVMETTEAGDTIEESAVVEEPVALPMEQDLRLRLVADEKSWIRVTTNEEDTREAMLFSGEELIFEGMTFDIKLGNAGGVRVFLNDSEVPVDGERGRTKTMYLDHQTLLSMQGIQDEATEQGEFR
jgi:hypothetical protein